MAHKLKVTLVRSPIHRPLSQKETVKGLGLRKLHGSRVLLDTPSIRGMILKVQHLVKVEPANGIPSEPADEIVSKPASKKLSNQEHPGDQHVADHEAGHAAILDSIINLVRKTEKDCDYDKLIVTIDPGVGTFGVIDYDIRNLPTNTTIGALLLFHCLAGVAADALGELLDKLDRREEGISEEEIKPYLVALLPRMVDLWKDCAATDLKSLNEKVVPRFLPGFELNLSVNLPPTLEAVRRSWSRVLMISKALLKYRTLTQDNYHTAVNSMAANPP